MNTAFVDRIATSAIDSFIETNLAQLIYTTEKSNIIPEQRYVTVVDVFESYKTHGYDFFDIYVPKKKPANPAKSNFITLKMKLKNGSIVSPILELYAHIIKYPRLWSFEDKTSQKTVYSQSMDIHHLSRDDIRNNYLIEEKYEDEFYIKSQANVMCLELILSSIDAMLNKYVKTEKTGVSTFKGKIIGNRFFTNYKKQYADKLFYEFNQKPDNDNRFTFRLPFEKNTYQKTFSKMTTVQIENGNDIHGNFKDMNADIHNIQRMITSKSVCILFINIGTLMLIQSSFSLRRNFYKCLFSTYKESNSTVSYNNYRYAINKNELTNESADEDSCLESKSDIEKENKANVSLFLNKELETSVDPESIPNADIQCNETGGLDSQDPMDSSSFFYPKD